MSLYTALFDATALGLNRTWKQSWSKITHYAGFDWAHDHHEVVGDPAVTPVPSSINIKPCLVSAFERIN